jgi:2,3-bisphosphoglycerate-dependent phosphoglycerate mutase
MDIRLLLVRHGRVDFDNQDFRVVDSPRGRQWDPPLDERGRQQADLLAARLSSMDPPLALYVSPFRRCLQTVSPYARALGRQATVDDGLAEVHVGEWEGVRFEDIFASNSDAIRHRIHEQQPMFSMAPGAETGAELRARVVPAVERLLASVEADAEAQRGNVVMVTHGGVINAYLGHVMGLEQDMFFIPENTSVNTIEVDGDRRRMRFINDVAHLAFPGIFSPPAGAEA